MGELERHFNFLVETTYNYACGFTKKEIELNTKIMNLIRKEENKNESNN